MYSGGILSDIVDLCDIFVRWELVWWSNLQKYWPKLDPKSALVFMKLERPQEETNCQMINDIE